MTTTPSHRKAAAVMWLAAGKSQRAAAEAAGVASATVSQWRRDPVFAAEVERARAVWEQEPRDGRALMARLAEIEERLTPALAARAGGRRVRVQVSIPPRASARKIDQITARVIAAGLRAAREAES